jgi:hypothetical protein
MFEVHGIPKSVEHGTHRETGLWNLKASIGNLIHFYRVKDLASHRRRARGQLE